jgi:hypothetical protein
MALGISGGEQVGVEGYKVASQSGEEIFASLALISGLNWDCTVFYRDFNRIVSFCQP